MGGSAGTGVAGLSVTSTLFSTSLAGPLDGEGSGTAGSSEGESLSGAVICKR